MPKHPVRPRSDRDCRGRHRGKKGWKGGETMAKGCGGREMERRQNEEKREEKQRTVNVESETGKRFG